ncbi:MAG: hypothetical protein EOO77_43205, partial [Oxalobacteraceae bacterium]
MRKHPFSSHPPGGAGIFWTKRQTGIGIDVLEVRVDDPGFRYVELVRAEIRVPVGGAGQAVFSAEQVPAILPDGFAGHCVNRQGVPQPGTHDTVNLITNLQQDRCHTLGRVPRQVNGCVVTLLMTLLGESIPVPHPAHASVAHRFVDTPTQRIVGEGYNLSVGSNDAFQN